jgi:phage shock protein PspC (stress-responsive transcriptional regulator)
MLGGVAAGLADYFGVDPIVFRAAFVVLVFLGGIGIFLYLLAWLMIPPAGVGITQGGRLPTRLLGRLRNRPSWLGVILLVVGGALVASRLGIWHPTIFWGMALLVVGIALFREDRAWRGEPARAPVATPAGASGAAVSAPEAPPESGVLTQPGAAGDESTVAVLPPRLARWPFGPRQAAPSSPPRVPRERSSLGWLALGVALLGLGVAAVLTETKTVDLHVSQFFALALTVVGAGLLLGTWRGRARWLILPGLALVPLVLMASLIDVPIHGGIGSRYIRPESAARIQRTYELTAGDLVLDLSELRFGPGSVPVNVTVAAGRITILAPEHVTVDARAHAGAGGISLFGELEQRGIRVDETRRSISPGSTSTLVLNLRTGIGEVSVFRVRIEASPVEPGVGDSEQPTAPPPRPSPTDTGKG